MGSITLGANIQLVGSNHLCTYSVAAELHLLVGNILCVKNYGERLLGKQLTDGALNYLPCQLKNKIKVYITRVCVLDKIFSRRMQRVLLLDQENSNVRLLRDVDVVFDVAPPLTLAERRRRPFKTSADIYTFVAGMCGLGLHTTGEIGLIDLRASQKSIEDWWTQLIIAQELSAQLRDFVVAHPAATQQGEEVFKDIEALNRELTRAVWTFRSKAALGG
jgi:hypothetical protein